LTQFSFIFPSGLSVTSTFKEPVRGWIDGLQGLIAMIFGINYGVIHIALVNLKVNVPWKKDSKKR